MQEAAETPGYLHKDSVEYWNTTERAPITVSRNVSSPKLVEYGSTIEVIHGVSQTPTLIGSFNATKRLQGAKASVSIASQMKVERDTYGVYTGQLQLFRDNVASNYENEDDTEYVASQTANLLRIGFRNNRHTNDHWLYHIRDLINSNEVTGFTASHLVPNMDADTPTGTWTFSGGVKEITAPDFYLKVKQPGVYHVVAHCVLKAKSAGERNVIYLELLAGEMADSVVARSSPVRVRDDYKVPIMLSQPVYLKPDDKVDLRIVNAESDTHQFHILDESFIDFTLIDVVPSGRAELYFSKTTREITQIS